MFKKISLIILLYCLSFSLPAKQLAGVELDETLMLDGLSLQLNGAGIRSKFIFDIYVAAFYTTKAVKQFAYINLQQPMRMSMHFVYKEVDKEKLTDAWKQGFEENLTAAVSEQLKDKINSFNGFFETVHKGDVITLDYLPLTGTRVSINKTEKGQIEGADFYKALLLIWLGKEPVAEDLKQQLLGQTNSDG